MGEPVNLPGHVNDRHLFAKVQICSGREGLWGQSLRLLTTPIIKNQLCLWFQDAVSRGAQLSTPPGSDSHPEPAASLTQFPFPVTGVAKVPRPCAIHRVLCRAGMPPSGSCVMGISDCHWHPGFPARWEGRCSQE